MNVNRRTSLTLLAGLAATTSRSLACLWDRDTLKDELATNPGILDLVLGQFPHHGDVYYQARKARLEKKPTLSVNEVNDLAVAHVRLSDFQKGMKLLETQITKTPGHYETLSNIGVTAKKSGDFQKGAEFIAKALAIKPEGHMGLGDWYLQALKWRAQFEKANKENPPKTNFLGQSYREKFRAANYGMGRHSKLSPAQKQQREHHTQMVRNDQSFADGFAALGDHLLQTGDLHLAYLSFTRATVLGHQTPSEIERRRNAHLRYNNLHPARHNAKAQTMVTLGLKWLEQYKAVEGELVKKAGDERKVTIAQVEAELLNRKIKRVMIS